jgi:hypothetical protein
MKANAGTSSHNKAERRTTEWAVNCPALGGQPLIVNASSAREAEQKFRQQVSGLSATAELSSAEVSQHNG